MNTNLQLHTGSNPAHAITTVSVPASELVQGNTIVRPSGKQLRITKLKQLPDSVYAEVRDVTTKLHSSTYMQPKHLVTIKAPELP